MAKPYDIICRALKDIGALEAGETPTADAAQDAFDMLNDMLDQWSNEDMMTFRWTEIVFPVVQNQTQYTIGPSGSVYATFVGSIDQDILTVTSATQGGITLNMTITGAGIPAGTEIKSFITGGGVGMTQNGTYRLNQRIGVIPSETITGYYQKPLNINSAFVRVNTNQNGVPIMNGGLDYPISVLGLDEYQMIGLETLNGPWPKALYYNPGDVLGNLYVWPNPSQGEMHIFVDSLMTRYQDMYEDLPLPQGYTNCIRWNLAERLMPMYGKSNAQQIQMIVNYANKSKGELKRTNMAPAYVARYDEVITSSRSKDAGWILSGGFFR